MSKGIFVTATGTDVGKTYVTGLLVKALRKAGLNAGYYKAALSGAELVDGELIPGDCAWVANVAGLDDSPQSLVSYIYKTAVSPHLAAKLEKQPIDPDVIVADFAKAKQKYDYLTMEGSGGIICPLRLDEKTFMLADMIQLLDLDIFIVALAGLGTINSVVLTTEYAKNRGIAIKGIILNHYEPDNFLHQDNKQEIEHLTGLPVIACIGENDQDLDIDPQQLCSYYKEF